MLIRSSLVSLSVLTALALAGCSDDTTTADPTPTPSSSESPIESPSVSPSESPSTKPSPTASVRLVVKISLEDGKVSPLAEQIEVKVDELLILDVTSDRAGELHVHSSPEESFDIEPGASRFVVSFERPGTVDIEEHESGALVIRALVR